MLAITTTANSVFIYGEPYTKGTLRPWYTGDMVQLLFPNGNNNSVIPPTSWQNISIDGTTYTTKAAFVAAVDSGFFLPSGGAIASVAAADGSLIISPTTGNVLARIATAFSNAFTVFQTVKKDAIAVTPTTGLVLSNTQAATTGIRVQISPRMVFSGRGWISSSNHTQEIACYVIPNGAGNQDIPKFVWSVNKNGTWTESIATLDGNGNFVCNNLTALGLVLTGSPALNLNGDINFNTAGASVLFKEGGTLVFGTSGSPANPCAGSATLVNGVVVVATTAVLATDLISITLNQDNIAALGTTSSYRVASVDIVTGVSFKIVALKVDTSLNTADNSVLNWFIFRQQ